jgi:hypothetical protein
MGKIPSTFRVSSWLNFLSKYNSNFFLKNTGVLLWIFRGINLGKIPRKIFDIYSRKNSDIFSEKFRHILGKIPRNFSMLALRILCFTGDGSSEELT